MTTSFAARYDAERIEDAIHDHPACPTKSGGHAELSESDYCLGCSVKWWDEIEAAEA